MKPCMYPRVQNCYVRLILPKMAYFLLNVDTYLYNLNHLTPVLFSGI